MERVCGQRAERVVIHIIPAPEPATFDEEVRQPGLSAIAELVGEAATLKRPGPRREPIEDHRERIPADKFPSYWTRALGDLLDSYDRICAYTCFYIEPVTGAASVDHMIPKSRRWDRVYEWLNYRLACSLMNSRKGVVSTVLDPFEIETGWFTLELVGFQVAPAESLSSEQRKRVEHTIDELGLNKQDCCGLREEYAVNYWSGHISLHYLAQRAPFVAMELRRQGRILSTDSK